MTKEDGKNQTGIEDLENQNGELQQVAAAFSRCYGNTEEPIPQLPSDNFIFRVIRFPQGSQLTHLTHDPERKVTFICEGSALPRIMGKKMRQILATLGYPPPRIERYFSDSTQFALLLAPRKELETEIFPADTESLIGLAAKLDKDHEKEYEYALEHKTGILDPVMRRNDMRLEKAWDVIAQTTGVNGLYMGNCTVYPNTDELFLPPVTELLIRNIPIADIPGHVVVTLPYQAQKT